MNQTYLKVAIKAARESAPIFKKFFGRPKSVKIKGGDPRDLVTEIDRKIETQIRKIILKNFPNHKIIGEEFGGEKLAKNDLVWIIDPIDGTTNYIHGLPFCCVSIGLWDSEGPLVGVVYNPVANYLFSAARGQGAFLNGKRIQVSGTAGIDHAYGAFGWGRNLDKATANFPKLVRLMHKIRSLGSSVMEICLCAAGIFDFDIHSELFIWDFAAAAIIVKEAGGKITELDGRKITLNTKAVVATNGKLHKQLLTEFKKAVII